jgi:predicted DNA-binding transcriptional regulator AlpA
MQTNTRINPDSLYRVKRICRHRDNPSPLIDVSPATWWAGVKSGRFPKPVHLGTRITCWRGSDLLALIEAAGAADGKAA